MYDIGGMTTVEGAPLVLHVEDEELYQAIRRDWETGQLQEALRKELERAGFDGDHGHVVVIGPSQLAPLTEAEYSRYLDPSTAFVGLTTEDGYPITVHDATRELAAACTDDMLLELLHQELAERKNGMPYHVVCTFDGSYLLLDEEYYTEYTRELEEGLIGSIVGFLIILGAKLERNCVLCPSDTCQRRTIPFDRAALLARIRRTVS